MGQSFRMYGPDRRAFAIVCTRGRGAKKNAKPCTFCNTSCELLCDGSGCDVPVCGGCAVSVRALDKDFCPRCIVKTVDGCAAAAALTDVACAGPETERSADDAPICLAHSLCFTSFLRSGGFNVWKRPDLDQAEKRRHLREWVQAHRLELNPQLEQLTRKVSG